MRLRKAERLCLGWLVEKALPCGSKVEAENMQTELLFYFSHIIEDARRADPKIRP